MMRVLDPTYTLRVIIKSKVAQCWDQTRTPIPNLWDPINGQVGCDQALRVVRDALAATGLDVDVFFERFEHS